MAISESDLKRWLFGDDDGEVRSTLRRFFRPEPRFSAPMFYDWVPLPDLDVVLGDGEGGGMIEAASRRLIDLANAADAALRQRRFTKRRSENPQWPVVVCEGDSWVSHPFIDEICDHLFDDEADSYHVLNRGAAGDRLATVAREREHEVVLDQMEVSALVLSGGGNDLLVDFAEFLHRQPHPEGSDPSRLVTAAVDVRLEELMGVMRAVLDGVRAKDAALPIFVHGYDYLRVAAPKRGNFLSPHFDTAGIEDQEQRQGALDCIVDRFNDHLARTIAEVPGVDYVDVRGTVPDGEWYDEIHPDDVGFGRIADVLGERVRDRLEKR